MGKAGTFVGRVLGSIKKYDNCIAVGAATLFSALAMGLVFDFYFDLNDDTMMRDIMAGIYSGAPDGHNMQTLYPLGAFLALCYRLCGRVPWYGVFLCLCQSGCFYLLGLRLLCFFEKKSGKLPALAAVLLFQWGIWLTHMVNIQYTITCAMLAATAIFWFMTTPDGLSAGTFVKKNIPAVLLAILACQLRPEMLLLALPFIGFAGLLRLWEEKPVFTGENLKKYGGVLGLMLLGIFLSLCIDLAAYGSGDWRDFRRFFDARTTVYDFYPEVVTQDRYSDDLASQGVPAAKQLLLRNYNFGLDEEIDTEMLEKIAAYAAETVGGTRDWDAVFREKILQYRYRTFHRDDAPYNLLLLLGYAANTITIVIIFLEESEKNNRRKACHALLRAGIQLALLLLLGRSIWMFILLRGRDPERITHSLYLVEALLLLGMVLWRGKESGRGRRRFLTGCCGCLFFLLAAGSLPGSLTAVRADQNRREAVNRDWEAIDSYCRKRPENFYLEDVYSTVAFSGKLFATGERGIANYDIAGGWMCKSPLYREKLALFGIGAADEALLQDRVWFIMSDAEELERGLGWLVLHYAEKGVAVEIREVDEIAERYRVYQISTVPGEQ